MKEQLEEDFDFKGESDTSFTSCTAINSLLQFHLK
jgi:hypothetical protein